MKNRLFILAACLICALAFTGCKSDQLAQWIKAKQTAEAVKAPTTQAITTLQVEIAKLPDGDPVRQALEEKLEKALKVLSESDAWIAKADAAIHAINTGNFTDPALQKAVEGIPYGELGLALVAGVWGIFNSRQAKDAVAATQKAERAVVELAGDVKEFKDPNTPWSEPTAYVLDKLGVETPSDSDL